MNFLAIVNPEVVAATVIALIVILFLVFLLYLAEKKLLPDFEYDLTVQDESEQSGDVDVYTHVRRDNNRFIWHQEVNDKIIPKSISKAPLDANPWLPLRFNTVDGEPYGRGRVEEFMGDLKSLEALSQAITEGSERDH